MMEYKGSAQNGLSDKDGFSVKVFGIGGAGANALDRIALEGMDGAELVAMNTDIRALTTSVANSKIQLGTELTKGLGAGGDPELGREAAVEAADPIRETVKDQSIIFLCVGLGGGTGSGAAPVVARLAEQSGAFVVVFATFPFSFESGGPGKPTWSPSLRGLFAGSGWARTSPSHPIGCAPAVSDRPS